MTARTTTVFALCAVFAVPAWAQTTPDDPSNATATEEIDEVIVTGVRERLYRTGAVKDVIQKTEVVDDEVIAARQAVNLSQAIAASPGVRVSNECSMCGVKRIMLNGMRGEHTTILTDGMPLHTMIAGYYAVDALAMTGVKRIEIARGAGASLIAPEAIGGTINVISREAEQTGLALNATIEEDDGYLVSAFGTLVSDDGRHRFSVVSQFDRHDRVDGDDNGVSEAPLQDNRNLILRLSSDLSLKDNITVRAAYIDSEIFGGTMELDNIGSVLRDYDGIESPQLFEDDDVRKQFIGAPWETTEWIDTERFEGSASWLHEFNGRYNTTVSAGFSRHDQDSFYEGFDYAAVDELRYFDFRNNFIVNDKHLLTFGADLRDEQMRSTSAAGEISANYIEDSFDYEVIGVYLQDTWTISDDFEIAAAVRFDTVEADFVAPEKPGVEIDTTVVAPRLDARYVHNGQWSSRFSIGQGYRAPLSFFETDHGILDSGDGFAIDVSKLEESLSVAYALSYEGPALSATLSLAQTEVDNLAAMDETPSGVPLLTQLAETASVFSSDIALSYDVNNRLSIAGTIERFDYDRIFRSSYAIAPIEERVTSSIDYIGDTWSLYASAIWIGERDLAKYGYEGFNVFDTVPKSTIADSYVTVDLKISRDIGENLSLYAGAFNLFDETQAGSMETPLFWDADGGYDVGYIYGPLRGREIYVGIEYDL